MTTEHTISPVMPLPPIANDNDSVVAAAAAMPVANDNGSTFAAAAPASAHPAAAVTIRPAPEKSALGSWFARHRDFTHKPVTYLGYQFLRSSIATIPYGFMMALGHHVFNLFSIWGQKAGLTAKGIEEFGKQGGVLGLEKLANTSKAVEQELYQAGAKGVFGRGLMRLGNSPMNAAIQIGLGFTLFRFTGGIVKNLRDRIFAKKNTDEQVVSETKNWWQTVKETARVNWPAESTATPIAAIVLGFMSAHFTPPAKEFFWNRIPGERFVDGVKRVWSSKSKLFQNSMVWTLSYSLFFLLAECIFKDKQIQRGLWKGHPNSLKNGPDDVVGGPGAITYHTPEDDPAKLHISNDLAEAGLFKAVDAKAHAHTRDEKAEDSQEKLKYPFFTGEPSWGRFIFRRVLPVCLGISAYAALKRVGYLIPTYTFGGRVASMDGTMQALTVAQHETMSAGEHVKHFLKNSVREGKATAMFGALWASTDFFGEMYDNFFHKLQKPENAVPLNDNQQKHHQELLVRLNEKFPLQGQGRAA